MPDISLSGAVLQTVRRIFSFRSATTETSSTLINRIIENRARQKHHIIINAEESDLHFHGEKDRGGKGIETRATIGHIQRGGTPTCKDRVYASIMGASCRASGGKSNRIVAYKDGKFVDFDIQEALNMKKDIPEEQYEVSKLLVR